MRRRHGGSPGCTRIAALQDTLRLLSRIGVPLERYLARHRLSFIEEANPAALIPHRHQSRFLTDVIQSEGIENFPPQAAAKLHSAIVTLSGNPAPPTLLAALRKATAKFPHLTSSTIEMDENPDAVSISRTISPLELSYDSEWIVIFLLVGIVRRYLGGSWHPHRIYMPPAASGFRWVEEHFPDTSFIPCRDHWRFDVPRRLLHSPPRVRSLRSIGKLDSTAPSFSVITIDGYYSSVNAIIDLNRTNKMPTIGVASEILGISTRTLQRRLSEEGRNYGEMVIEQRYLAARELLDQTDESIISIALELGYSSSTNFVRAFRHFTGITPMQYRKQSSMG